MESIEAGDIKVLVDDVLQNLEMPHINPGKVFCMRSRGSKTRAYARIWSLPGIWRQVLNLEVHYIIEVISPRFDNLKPEDQERVIIHELMHIPKKFSGGLVPHLSSGRRINVHSVEKLHQEYKRRKVLVIKNRLRTC